MDAVYVVRPGEYNEELRYSIRSLVAHLPFDQLVIAGHVPGWLKPDVALEVPQARGAKQSNARANLDAAIASPDVSEPFLYLNDDMFVMAPLPRMPMLHNGPVAEFVARHAKLRTSGYMQAAIKTAERLAELGVRDPLSYELHVPMVVDKPGLSEALDAGRGIAGLHWRTLYGNLAGVGGELMADCKVYTLRDEFRGLAFLSTSDRRFKHYPVGAYIRDAFPTPSAYESLTYDNVVRDTRAGGIRRSPIPRHRSRR